MAPKLAEHFNVFALTRRGHGKSEKPDSGYELEAFIEDINNFLNHLGIKSAIFVGHSFGGVEAAYFALAYPHKVGAVIYLDAMFPKLDPQPDLSGDPIWSVVPLAGPNEDDLGSRLAYMAYYKRRRPDWAKIWCPAIEANLGDRVTVMDDGRLRSHHDDALLNGILGSLFPPYPEYDRITVPQLAIVPDGDYHPSAPMEADDALRSKADEFWLAVLRPWVRRRTSEFQLAAPTAKVVEFSTPFHHLFLAEDDRTYKVICDFL